jgi:hypothetical protein
MVGSSGSQVSSDIKLIIGNVRKALTSITFALNQDESFSLLDEQLRDLGQGCDVAVASLRATLVKTRDRATASPQEGVSGPT